MDETKQNVDPSASRESLKLFFEFYKHLTTLSTGSIVVAVTFLAKEPGIGDQSADNNLPEALNFFIFCILGCVICMFVTAACIRGLNGWREDLSRGIIIFGSTLVGGSFLGGLWCLASIAQDNL